MNEEFISYIWQYRLFHHDLQSVEGKAICVLDSGEVNTNSGPDYFNARLRIDQTLWAGNIEIHLKASDWFRHGHHTDKEYNSVILHVVYEYDDSVIRTDGSVIPCLELKNKFDPEIYLRYFDFMQSRRWVSCQNLLSTVEPFVIRMFLERLLICRLERKTHSFFNLLRQCDKDLDEAVYRMLARSFGGYLNADPFERIAASLPLRILKQLKPQPAAIEMAFLGHSGIPKDSPKDSYSIKINEYYKKLCKKYDLQGLQGFLFKFMRLHPCGFPTLRLSQFAMLISKCNKPGKLIIEAGSIKELFEVFKLQASDYWNTHYSFGKKTRYIPKNTGIEASKTIIINAIIPMIFAYGKYTGTESYKTKAMDLYRALTPENNSIIRKWQSIGIKPLDALESQALIELNQYYCKQKRCLECRIGNYLLRNSSV